MAATVTRETERKYDAPAGAVLPDLRGLPRVAAQTEADEVVLDATYHDTAGLDLARVGITLRLRSGGKDAGWHLKIPTGAAATRTELRLPAGPDVPAEFLGLLTARLRGRELIPVARIGTRRRYSTLTDAAGDQLAEICLDAVTAEAVGGEPVCWTEVEVELAEGAAHGGELLEAADRALLDSGLTPSVSRMKLEAALGDALAAPEAPFAPGKKARAGDVVVAYLRTQFEELLTCDVLVRRAQPDSVHSMRVAARRLRAALQAFRRLFRGARADELISGLRWLGQELGRARDEEVLRDLLLDQLAQLPAASVIGPVRARIAGHCAPRLADAEQHALDVLGSERYLSLLNDIEACVTEPPLSAAAERRARKELPRLVGRAQGRIRRRMTADLHEARKAAKRARYAAEVAFAVSGEPARDTAKALKQLQTTLGDHHDAVIAAAQLRELAVRAHSEAENSYTYGVLHERLDERARRLAERARREWRCAERPRRTAWMH